MTAGGVVLAVMARAPSLPGKTRLLSALRAADGEGLCRALLRDTLAAVVEVRGVERAFLYTPLSAEREMRALQNAAAVLIPQRGDGLGERMRQAFAEIFARRAHAVILIGSDLPTLPPSYLQRAVDELQMPASRVVIGPARDGGYYLVGLNAPAPALFDDIPWSTNEVFARTLDRVRSAGLEMRALPEWYDVDTAENLVRACRESDPAAHVAAHTRQWVSDNPTLLGDAGITEGIGGSSR